MHNSKDYTYRVFWSEEDNEYVGTVAEFPYLSFLDKDHHKTFDGIVDAVGEVLKLYQEDGEAPPEPLGRKVYSGTLSLRLTPEQHKKVAMQAAEAGVSINKLLASKI